MSNGAMYELLGYSMVIAVVGITLWRVIIRLAVWLVAWMGKKRG